MGHAANMPQCPVMTDTQLCPIWAFSRQTLYSSFNKDFINNINMSHIMKLTMHICALKYDFMRQIPYINFLDNVIFIPQVLHFIIVFSTD